MIDLAFGQRKRDLLKVKADLDQAVDDWLSEPDQSQRPPISTWVRLNSEEQRAVDARLAQNSIDPPTNSSEEDAQRSRIPRTQDGRALNAASPVSHFPMAEIRDDGLIRLFLDFYNRSIVKPFWSLVDELARSPLGDPALFASMEGLGPGGPAVANAGILVTKALRAMAAIGLGVRELEAAGAPVQAAVRAARLAENVVSGVEEETFLEGILKGKQLIVDRQVTIVTYMGTKTRVDFVVLDPITGKLTFIESKATTRANVRPDDLLRPNQTKAFAELKQGGGVVVGKGKPIIPGGTRLPQGTEVEIYVNRSKGAP